MKIQITRNDLVNQMLGLFMLMFSILAFISCEGYRCSKGIVVDMETSLPIDSVAVEIVSDGLYLTYTDSLGKFGACNSLGGCVPDCKDLVLRFSKSNYKTVTLINPENDAIVIMEQE